MRSFRRGLSLLLSVTLLATSPVTWAVEPSLPASTASPSTSDVDPKQMTNDTELLYWNNLNQDNPLAAEFALGPPVSEKPLWLVEGQNSLLDSDPFFMFSQSWQTATDTCADAICFSKTAQNLTLALAGSNNVLELRQPLTPILDTRDYILLSADSADIFRRKADEEQHPGEGVFFIAKRDLGAALNAHAPVPIFFFPLPGDGWTGRNDEAFELESSDQIVVYNRDDFGLPIDRSDFAVLEKVERDNLVLAQTWSFLEGNARQDGVTLPRPNTTLGFGLFLSGQLPSRNRTVGQRALPALRAIAQHLAPVPGAEAEPLDITNLDKLRKETTEREAELNTEAAAPVEKSTLRNWIAPLITYGGTAVAAVGMYHHIDWSELITADMPQRILTVSEMLGSVLVASVVMKYTVHKSIFDKKYPKTPDETFWQRVNKEHKGILDELTHGLWFSLAFIPQGTRHILDFLKDRFFPNNKMIHKAWEATMGFQMRQSSRLAMNWKTFYLGSLVFGMADSVLVAIHLLIFTPWLVQHFGWNVGAGAATAAFASAEILRNFSSYLQSGAHTYSADVKMINQISAEKEAARQMRSRGINPDAARNADEKAALVQAEMEKRFAIVGLPGDDEFLYDPITVLESVTAKAGFSIDSLKESITPEQFAALKKTNFVLSRRRWGLIKPALDRALNTARAANSKSPSATGARVVALLEWASKNRSLAIGVAEQAWDTAASDWGREGLRQSIADAMLNESSPDKNPNFLATLKGVTKGAFRHFISDGTQEARDIRLVLHLMSTSGSALDMAAYLPKTWKDKAGSEEASLLGAELFHRAFTGYMDNSVERITPSPELESAYGPRAERVMERISKRDPSLFADPFVRQTRYWELMARLQERDKARQAVLNFKPKEQSELARKQWSIARANAEARMKAFSIEDDVSSEWLGLAALYQERTGQVVEAADWARSNRYRFVVAQELAKEVGLTAYDVADSEFIHGVIVDAARQTESQLSLENERIYLSKLSPEDQRFYEAEIFTNHFVSSYVDLSVRADTLPATSPEYPGRFQRVRRALVGVPGGKYMSAVVRSVETLFRNEETAYAPGVWSALDRNLPLIPDLWHAFWRSARTLPYLLSMSYLTAYYVWQIHMPYLMWSMMVGFGFTGSALIEINNRYMKNYGVKPMNDVASKLKYSFWHSIFTNPLIMLIQAIAQPTVDFVEKDITGPITDAMSDCGKLLRHRP